MKTCSRCKVEKPIDEFARSVAKKDGRNYSCRVCVEAGRKERLLANPERAQKLRETNAAYKRSKAEEISEKLKQRRATDDAFAERTREYGRKFREANLEKERIRDASSKVLKREDEVYREKHNANMRKWAEKNRERVNGDRRARLKNDPEYAEKIRAIGRKRYLDNPHARRTIALKTLYGIGIEEYDQMYDKQGGKCLICDECKPKGGYGGLVVDHCHAEGHIRGLLCAKCNTGLGNFRDNVGLLQKAIEYLTK